MPLDDIPHWLHPLFGDTPGSSLLVGGVGHLLLNREEEAVVSAALESRVLPMLREMADGRAITLFTGLAPGADFLLMDRATSWCRRHGVPLRKVGLCAVPARLLIEDWIHRAQRDGYTLSEADRQKLHADLQTHLDDCDALVLFYRADEETLLNEAEQRQERYRHQAAVLAQYSDMLLAILHDGHDGKAGGTTEVVAWRQHPSHIPALYSTRRFGQPLSAENGLMVINPKPAKLTVSRLGGDAKTNKVLESAHAALKAGNELLANDILFRALHEGLQHPELHYLRILVLAMIGSSTLALHEYEQLAPPMHARDERWLTLRGRIHKDLALRGDRRTLFLKAAEDYLAAWELTGSSYSAINTASMYALAGDREQSHRFAHLAMAAVRAEPSDNPEQQFYTAATQAEAHLLLGDLDTVSAILTQARQQPVEQSRIGRTRRQLLILCDRLGVDRSLLAPLTPLPLMMMRRFGNPEPGPGNVIDTRWIADLPPVGGIFMGLCDSVDLQMVEAFQARGDRTHLVLPYRADRLIKSVHKHYGEDLAERLRLCLQRAVHVHTERGFLSAEFSWAASHVTERTLGLALLAGQRSGGQLRIVEMDPAKMETAMASATCFDEGPDRTALARKHIYRREPAPVSPEGRRMVGLIFADFAGFQRLEDRDLPYFWQGLMTGISQLLLRYRDAILLRQTWGDALHLVTTDAQSAASIMTDIQHYLDQHRLKPGAPLANLTLRISGHYAPAYEGHDPIHDALTYYGTQLSLAARIEPVTPPGQIYATEAFAARLAIEDASQFALEYAGEIELAKRFGAYRLYSLRRVRDWR